jgi:hypothetical protein
MQEGVSRFLKKGNTIGRGRGAWQRSYFMKLGGKASLINLASRPSVDSMKAALPLDDSCANTEDLSCHVDPDVEEARQL